MSGEGKNPQSSPVIAVTATKSGEAVPPKAPAIGTRTASTITSSKSVTATATSGTSTSSGFAANAGGQAEAAGFSAAASSDNNEKPQGFTVTAQSEEEFIESVVAANAQEAYNNANDLDEEGKVTVKKDYIKELLKDYEIPKDESIKEAFRSMVANYFVFGENYAILKKDWKDKPQDSDPSLMKRIQGADLSPEVLARTLIKSCADKCKINKKSGVQDDKTASSPTVTPVPKSPDPTDNNDTSPPAEGGTFTAQLVEKGKGLLSLLKKKITDLIGGANGTQGKDNTSSFDPVATSGKISEEVRQKADSKEKTPTDQSKVSDKAGINPKTLTSLYTAEAEIAQLSNSSSTLDSGVGLTKTTAEPAAMLMQKQHAAAAAEVANSSQSPKPKTSDGTTTMVQPVVSPHMGSPH